MRPRPELYLELPTRTSQGVTDVRSETGGNAVKRNTTALGDLTELEVATALARIGKKLLKPISAATRYDLLVDNEDGTFTRIQCKTGILREGRITFRLYSVSGHNSRGVPYRGQVDAFGVYCPQTKRAYLVPVEVIDRCGTIAALRVEPARNGQQRGIRSAIDFMIQARDPSV